MGFQIYEFDTELKQHINLSELAWIIVEDDIRNFYISEKKQSFSGFLNRIFFNFYQEARATISMRYVEMHTKLDSLFSSKEFPRKEGGTADLYVSKLLEEYERTLLEEATSHSKGIGKKFRVNKQNIEVLKESGSSEYYDDSIGAYMKAVFEEYVQLPSYQRELIFFKDTVDKVELALAKKNKLKISLMQKLTPDGQNYYTKRFYVMPYKIACDKTGNFNYLIGYAEEIGNEGALGEKRIASFRISRIEKIEVMSSMSGFLSKSSKDLVDKELLSKTPQFLAGELIDIKIIFNEKGLESFARQIYMRPSSFDKVDKYTYVFHCTEFQAMNYFFKFGRDIEVVAPLSLRENIKNRYFEAWKNYEKN